MFNSFYLILGLSFLFAALVLYQFETEVAEGVRPTDDDGNYTDPFTEQT